jgi:hypothetical protein
MVVVINARRGLTCVQKVRKHVPHKMLAVG